MLAVDAGGSAQWVAGGAAVILLSIAITLIGRQVKNLLAENRQCNRRLGILFRVVLQNKLDVPMEYFDETMMAAREPLPPPAPETPPSRWG